MAIPDARLAAPHQYVGPTVRITALTSRLLRLEHSPDGVFTDAPTQVVQCRELDAAPLRVVDTDRGVELFTEHLRVRFDGSFTPAGLEVDLLGDVDGGYRSRWRHGQPVADPVGFRTNLFGTARTLDYVDGRCELEPGLLSTVGHSLLDDSASLELDDEQMPRPRAGSTSASDEREDYYFFGYGRDYAACLRDFFRLTGPSPLLPRFALGNWWSRYHRYDEAEYLDLMDRFAAQRIPFSVAVIDMDWHVTDVDPALGSGWTGYTWNRELFPDPPRFLAALHERGLRVSLNTHPADGIRAHEDSYERVCAALGRPADGRPVAFDIADPAFRRAYLEQVHHRLEDEGVDFWWIDWQQGAVSAMPGLDPLWMLDHLHYLDSARRGRPLTFSRYAGPGSHRYPIGFSGDTVVSWESLAFQPEFTATAANIGYHWWSHDIGGHFRGGTSDELATRWLQLGVFSPITRLHSSNDEFNAKEPWRFGPRAEAIQAELLRLRHSLVPYLYSAMWTAHTDGTAPVRPLYHDEPHQPRAYEHPTSFRFGPDLLVAPIVTPDDAVAHLGCADTWLPDGTWRDLLTGRAYTGGRELRLHRPLESLPVLARCGAVVPLAADPLAPVDAPAPALALRVVVGADGGCVVREDDGSADPARRELPVRWTEDGDHGRLVVGPQRGGPTSRAIVVELLGATTPGAAPLDGALGARLDLGRLDLAGEHAVDLPLRRLANPDADDAFAVLHRADITFEAKNRAHAAVRDLPPARALAALDVVGLPDAVRGALVEICSR